MMSKNIRAAATLLTLGMGMMAAQELLIERATYGHDRRYVDVTDTVRRALAAGGGRLDIVVSNETFQMDPAPAQPKTLRIQYFVNGRPMREEIPENARLLLPRGAPPMAAPPPPPPPPVYQEGPRLRIISGQYGAGDRVVNVTGLLQSQVREGMLVTRVGPDTMLADPAPRRPKVLFVEYEYMGRRYRTQAPDFAQLQLPEPSVMQGAPPSAEPMPPPMPPPAAGPFRIISAGYGAHGRFVDVRRILESRRAPDGTLTLPVNNMTMGGDPFIGTPKVLRIEYEFEGRPMHRELHEGETLVLP